MRAPVLEPMFGGIWGTDMKNAGVERGPRGAGGHEISVFIS